MNKKASESLVKCGAFDSLAGTRTGMMEVLPRAQAAGQQAQQDARSGQWSFFDLERRRRDEDAAAHHDPPIMPLPDDRKQLNEWEKETLGLFLSSHPLKEVRPALRARVDCSLADLAAKKDGEWVTVGGMIAECKRIRTKKGDPMMFATLDDLEGQVELLVFNSAYAANADKVDVDKIVIVRGRVDHKEEGETKLVAQEVEAFEPTAEEVAAAAERGGRRADRPAADDPRVAGRAGELPRGPPRGGRPPPGRPRAAARRGRAPAAARTRLARVRGRRLPSRAGRPDRRLAPGRLSQVRPLYTGLVPPVPAPHANELHECRQCCSFCDRVVHPSGCIASGCQFLYLYDDEETGRRFMGCMNKVFRGEIDRELFEQAERTRHGFGGVKMTGLPLPQCRASVERAYDGYTEAFDCVNPGFFTKPVLDDVDSAAFDLRDEL